LTDSKQPVEQFADPPGLPGRWTVCAMLFVATSINYMDRQVIAILKPVLAQSTIHLAPLLPGWPTVEKSLSMTEVQYGSIVSAFQIAYAVGVIFAGAWWTGLAAARLSHCHRALEPVCDGTRAGEFSLWVRRGAGFSGTRRERKFSRGDQGDGGVVSAAGAVACHGDLQLGRVRRGDSGSGDCALGGMAFWMARQLSDDRFVQPHLDRVVVGALPDAERINGMEPRGGDCAAAGSAPEWWRRAGYRQTWDSRWASF